jgi:diguanylate cyclase (GGDEF)-like protein
MLLFRESGNWYIEAEGNADNQKITLTKAESIQSREDIPLVLIKLVQDSKKPLCFKNPQMLRLEPYIQDIYLAEAAIQSALLFPILYQENLQCIIYLENKSHNKLFHNAHIETVQLLSSQVAISLENSRLYYQATYDSLTGMGNKNLLFQMFTVAANNARRYHNIMALALINIHNFKKINETYGYDFGDKVLCYLAHKIEEHFIKHDLATRIERDHFILLLDNIKDAAEASQLIEVFLKATAGSITIDTHEINLTVYIGISLFPSNAEDIQGLITQATIALSRAHGNGRGDFQFYNPLLDKQIKEENLREIELQKAIKNNELCLYFQPVFRSKTHTVSYFEVLIRWNHPQKGILSAGEFIPLAEKTGLIIPMSHWLLHAACQQIKQWQAMNLAPTPLAVNISGIQFKEESLNIIISKLLTQYNISPHLIEIEFTESAFIEQTEKVLADIIELKKLNVKLVLDDFGTFYSSLAYLRRFPVDKIKIDQTFVRDIVCDAGDRALILAIVAMAHTLNLEIVAEGIENEEQLIFLENAGVDELQGYYLGHPMNAQSCSNLLKKSA